MPDREEYYDPTSPAQSNKHWLPWIQRQLILKDILAQTPEMPEPYKPDYEKWKKVFEQLHVDRDTTLIGHSCGGGFLLRWLSENKVKVGKVALVAPWLDPDKTLNTGMFDFVLDTGFPERTEATRVFISNERRPDVQATVDRLKQDIVELDVRFIPDRGHFCMSDMHTEEFPELAEFLLS